MKGADGPTTVADFQIDISAQLGAANGQDETYVRCIVLIVWDHGLQQTQDADQAYNPECADDVR